MKFKNSRGFSLLEIIIAMLILSLVVAGLFGLFVTSHGFIIEAGHRLQAINYARQVAETLKVYVSESATVGSITNAGTGAGYALDEGADPLNPTQHNPTTDLGLTGISIPGTTGATCTYTVDEDVVVGTTATTLEAVTITTSWTEP